MKKTVTLLFIMMVSGISGFSQSRFGGDTLLFENFEVNDLSEIPGFVVGFPGGFDSTWVDADLDGIADASGTGRPDEWFLSFGFADADSANTVMAGNSWTNDANAWLGNYLILPPIHFNDASGMLYWKSAPRQTPRFLDGYFVLGSTTGNDHTQFSDTLRKFAEYQAQPGPDSSFSNFQFSAGFIHGFDGQYIEYHGDSIRFKGILRPDSVSLAAYAGQTVYLAFWQGTHDDNLISVDDIRVSGAGSVGIQNETKAAPFTFKIYPNPVTDKLHVQYVLPNSLQVDMIIQDVTGKQVKSLMHAGMIKGPYDFNFNVSELNAGMYQVVIKTPYGNMTQPFVKQ